MSFMQCLKYALCHHAERRYAHWRYAECRDAKFVKSSMIQTPGFVLLAEVCPWCSELRCFIVG
jgi:hypothetical protein